MLLIISKKLKKITKRIDRLFRDNLTFLAKTSKGFIAENNLFCYTNNANKSIRLSGFFNKKKWMKNYLKL